MTECPDCGGEAEWVEILIHAPRPKGHVYDCKQCGNRFDSRGILPDGCPKCPGCGFITHKEGSHCTECRGGVL